MSSWPWMECILDVKFAEFSLVKLSMLSAGCILGDMLWSWGVVSNILSSSSDHLLLSLFLLFFVVHLLIPVFFLGFSFFVCLFMLSCTAVCNQSPTYLSTMWDHKWIYGEFWVQALSGSLLCSHASLNPNDVLCQVSLFIFCVLFPFQFVSMHNVLFTMQISFQLYTKPAQLYLKCYLHWFSARSLIIKHIILLVLIVCPFTVHWFFIL